MAAKDILHLVIPNDFSIRSLRLVKAILEKEKALKIQILMLSGIHLSDSIMELSYLSPSKIINQSGSEEFKSGCSLLKNTFNSNLVDLSMSAVFSNNGTYMQSFLTSRGIEKICLPNNSPLTFKDKKLYDPSRGLIKSGLPIERYDLEIDDLSFNDQLSDLFPFNKNI